MPSVEITKDDLLGCLMASDPRFIPICNDFVLKWENEAGELPYYLLMAEIARFFADDIRTGDAKNHPQNFKLIEEWHVNGRKDVAELATIGLLEDIQTHMLHDNTGLFLAEPYLLPESRKWWKKLEQFWEGDVTALRYE